MKVMPRNTVKDVKNWDIRVVMKEPLNCMALFRCISKYFRYNLML